MSERKPRPLWPQVTTALIGLPLLYVATFGPACWVAYQPIPFAREAVAAVYWPLGRLASDEHSSIGVPLAWYAKRTGKIVNGGFGYRAVRVPVGPFDTWQDIFAYEGHTTRRHAKLPPLIKSR